MSARIGTARAPKSARCEANSEHLVCGPSRPEVAEARNGSLLGRLSHTCSFGVIVMPMPANQTSTRDRALASVHKRIGEVEAIRNAYERAGDRSGAAASTRFLEELRRLLATQQDAMRADEG